MYYSQRLTANEKGETVYLGVREAKQRDIKGTIKNGRLTTTVSETVKEGELLAVYVRRRNQSIASAYEADGHAENGVSGWEYLLAAASGDAAVGVRVVSVTPVLPPGTVQGYYRAQHDGDTVTLVRI